MNTLDELLRYDSSTRNIVTRDLLESHAGSTDSIVELATHFSNLLVGLFKCEEQHLCRELTQWARFRAVFMLLPEQLLFGSPPIEEKPTIREHLSALGLDATPELVSAIKCICVNFRAKRSSTRKLGITDVYVKFPHVYQRMVSNQCGRCSYCGAPLTYGENAELDHLWPFYLGDDPHDGSNWCLCCRDCNVGKGEYPFYSLTSVSANWIGPNAGLSLTLTTRFAALVRDRACVKCSAGPTVTSLAVKKRVQSGCWILDNTQTVCLSCVAPSSICADAVA
jgi:hypothetical protein